MSNQNTDGVLSDASQLTAEHFEPLVDSVFVVTAIQSESSDTHADPVPDENATEDASLELKLVQVTRHTSGEKKTGLMREQFSLLFSTSDELMNACLPISHSELGCGSLLLSRVMSPLSEVDQNANWYEAVFG